MAWALAIVALGIVALGVMFNSASAEQPGQLATDADECVVYHGYDVCIPNMDNSRYIDDWDFELWARANPGEYACAALRADYAYEWFSPLEPLGSVVRDQFESLRLTPVNGRGCLGITPNGEVVVSRFYSGGRISSHWESDGNGGTGLLRRWYGERVGGPSPPFTDAENDAWPFMTRVQERVAWNWISAYSAKINNLNFDLFGNRGYEIYASSCTGNADIGCSNYYRLHGGEGLPDITGNFYTRNGFLYLVQVETDRPVAELFVQPDGTMTIAEYFYSSDQAVFPDSHRLTDYDRRGDLLSADRPIIVPWDQEPEPEEEPAEFGEEVEPEEKWYY